MYAQVVRATVRDEGWKRLTDLAAQWSTERAEQVEGFKEMYFLREINTENQAVFIIMWHSYDAAISAGGQPATDAYFKKLMELIEGDAKILGAETVNDL